MITEYLDKYVQKHVEMPDLNVNLEKKKLTSDDRLKKKNMYVCKRFISSD